MAQPLALVPSRCCTPDWHRARTCRVCRATTCCCKEADKYEAASLYRSAGWNILWCRMCGGLDPCVICYACAARREASSMPGTAARPVGWALERGPDSFRAMCSVCWTQKTTSKSTWRCEHAGCKRRQIFRLCESCRPVFWPGCSRVPLFRGKGRNRLSPSAAEGCLMCRVHARSVDAPGCPRCSKMRGLLAGHLPVVDVAHIAAALCDLCPPAKTIPASPATRVPCLACGENVPGQ